MRGVQEYLNTQMTYKKYLLFTGLLALLVSFLWSPSVGATARTFTSAGAALNGQGYVLTSDAGHNYAFNVPYRGNPTNFTGRIVGTATTADGQGYANISSIGQVYAYGTVQHRGNPTNFSGEIVDIAVTGDGRGYAAISSTGQVYAYGTVVYRGNPTNFSGRITRIAVTADGQGYMAVSSAGQFYAYGTVRAQPNPKNFSGEITDVSVTADGQGTVALSSAGQLYAYGTAKAWPNPVNFTGRMVGVSLTGNGQGLIAMSSSGQVYAYGNIAHRGNGDMGYIDNLVDQRYQQWGGSTSSLGVPTSNYFAVKDNGYGRHYQGGSIYWSANSGARVVIGQVKDKWASLGWENGFLGFPTTDTFQAKGGGLGQHFQGGSIYWSSATGAHEVHGTIRDKWASMGWENGFLGYPTSDEFGGGRNSRGSHFQGGSVYWSALTGAREVHGAIRDKWAALGWENSYLGLPISDETTGYNGQVLVSYFTGGEIYYNNAYGATDKLPPNVSDPIHTQGAPIKYAPPGRLSYSRDFPLNRTGYTHIPAKPELAFKELQRCFDCSYPVPGRPKTFPAQGQRLPLDACGLTFITFSPCKAPVTSYTNGRTFMRFTAQPGHFDGEYSTATFTFVDRGGALWLNVTGYVVNPLVPESQSRPMAELMWQMFADNLGQNIWNQDCKDGC